MLDRRCFLVLGASLLVGCGWISESIDRQLNAVQPAAELPTADARPPSDPKASPKPDGTTREPGRSGVAAAPFVADLHADTLLWDRDMLERADYGHVDLPRLHAGGVGLQVFSAVTKTPSKERTSSSARLIPEVRARRNPECIDRDNFSPIGLLHVLHGRESSTWFDTEARALSQAARLREAAARSERLRAEASSDQAARMEELVLVESAGDLRRLIDRRASDTRVLGGLQALEGAHWVHGDEAAIRSAVDRLHDAGFRMLAPTHRFGNDLAASSEGCDQLSGLTDAGRVFLTHAESKGIVVDLAHISDRGLLEALEVLEEPVVISHAGLRFDCPQDGDPDQRCDIERGLTREGVRAVALNGGVIGIGYWPQAVGPGLPRIASAFRSAYEALSAPFFEQEMRRIRPDYDPIDHLALGSDFDGAVATPFDAAGIGALFDELAREAADGRHVFTGEEIRRIAGVNVCRVFATRLAGGSPELASEICEPLAAPEID